MKLKTIAWILGGLAVAYAVGTSAFYLVMRQPPERFGAIMAKLPMATMIVFPFEPLWMSARKGTLSVGDAAPDVTLPMVKGNEAVTLSNEWRERPVALVFGSYT
jgi:hypothetical protein